MTKVVYFVCLLIRTEAPLLSRRASVAAAVPLGSCLGACLRLYAISSAADAPSF